MSDSFQLPPFIPVYLGWDEFLKQGKVSLAAYAVYVLLNRWCDWGSGIYFGCAATLSSLMGGRATTKEVQHLLYSLRRSRLVNYPLGTGKRGSFNILIHGFLPRVAGLRGYRLNAFATNSLEQPLYERLDGAGTADGLSVDGGRTVFRLSADGARTECRPLQEYKNLRSVRILKFQNDNSTGMLGGWVGMEPQPPVETPHVDQSASGTEEYPTPAQPEYAPEFLPSSSQGSSCFMDQSSCFTPVVVPAQSPSPTSAAPLPQQAAIHANSAAARLAERFWELQGSASRYENDVPTWAHRFANLITIYGEEQLSGAMEYAFTVDGFWSEKLLRADDPVGYFENKLANSNIRQKYERYQTAMNNRKARTSQTKESNNGQEQHTRPGTRRVGSTKTSGNQNAVNETIEWLRQQQQSAE